MAKATSLTSLVPQTTRSTRKNIGKSTTVSQKISDFFQSKNTIPSSSASKETPSSPPLPSPISSHSTLKLTQQENVSVKSEVANCSRDITQLTPINDNASKLRDDNESRKTVEPKTTTSNAVIKQETPSIITNDKPHSNDSSSANEYQPPPSIPKPSIPTNGNTNQLMLIQQLLLQQLLNIQNSGDNVDKSNPNCDQVSPDTSSVKNKTLGSHIGLDENQNHQVNSLVVVPSNSPKRKRSSIDETCSSSSSAKRLVKIENAESAPTEKTCCICFQHFDDVSDIYRLHLLKHMEMYEGKSRCPHCRVDCGHHEKMVDHFLMAHGGVEKLVCLHPSCVRSFRTERTLKMHAKKHVNKMF